jgi:hypothetical protein
MALFLVVLDYPSITDPAQKVALVVEQQMVIFSTNLLMYVFFGPALIVLALALYDQLKSKAPAIMQVATVIGIIWAGSLIADGMVSNAGIAPVVALYATDPAQAALHGLLKKVRDLGMPLVSVSPIEHRRADQSDVDL